MKKLSFYVLSLFVALILATNVSSVAFAQAPPEIDDPFATDDDDDTADEEEEAPPTLEIAEEEPPPAEEPPPEEEPPAEEPPAEEPPAEEPPPSLEMAEEPEPTHGAAAPASYSGGKTADSGPGLAVIGLGSLLGAAALRKRKK